MVLPMIFGILILVVVVYVAMRVLGNLVWGLLLIGMVFVASFFILGSFPNLKDIPIIGQWLPDLSGLPLTTGGMVNVIQSEFFNLTITNHSYSESGNLLVEVANAGRFDLGNFTVFVDGQPAGILNGPKDPLKSGESTTIEVDWQGSFGRVAVKTAETVANYPES